MKVLKHNPNVGWKPPHCVRCGCGCIITDIEKADLSLFSSVEGQQWDTYTVLAAGIVCPDCRGKLRFDKCPVDIVTDLRTKVHPLTEGIFRSFSVIEGSIPIGYLSS